MAALRPNETVLQGYWLDLGSRVVPDSNWERINALVANQLELLATGDDGITRLFRDPADDRFWELAPVAAHLPQGPPILTALSQEQVYSRYPQVISP